MRVALSRIAFPTLRSCAHNHHQSLSRPLLQQLGRQFRFVSSSPNTTPTSPAAAPPTTAAAAAAAAPPAANEEPPKEKLPPVDYVVTSEKELRNAKPPNLIRPIGLSNPPQPGENSGEDTRSWGQRRNDFVSYEKHIVKRKRLTNEMATPYFRDFSRLSKSFKGKSWFAPPLLFKADKALFFPNLMGRTLNTPERLDTTLTLHGKVSVVTVFSSMWAENQIKSWVDGLEEEVPALVRPEDAPPHVTAAAQRIDINIEENPLKAFVITMFLPRLQARTPYERQDQYFIVTKGVDKDVRHDMGLWNAKVGYVYLVDWNCRIRWAGSGQAEPEEREALVKGLTKLADDFKKLRTPALDV